MNPKAMFALDRIFLFFEESFETIEYMIFAWFDEQLGISEMVQSIELSVSNGQTVSSLLSDSDKKVK